MTWPLVILRVNRATYEDIQRRIIAAGQPDRIFSDGRISVDEVAIEIDPNGDQEDGTKAEEGGSGVGNEGL